MGKTLNEDVEKLKKRVEELEKLEGGELSYNADNVDDITINRWRKAGRVITVDFEARAKVNIVAGSNKIISLPFTSANAKGVVSWTGRKI